MSYPFRMQGQLVEIYRYRAKYTTVSRNDEGQDVESEVTEDFTNEEEAAATGGVVSELDASAYEWLDGMKAGTMDNAVKLYELGKAGWMEAEIGVKCAQISEACHAAIVAGCDVPLSDGSTGHFSMAETDQINLTTALAMVQQGAEAYPYHADGQLCKMYPAADIVAIAQAATAHKLYHTTYCNHLLAWAKRAESLDDLQAVAYGATLPKDLAANMNEVLAHASAG